jgi:hypothetical protein
MVPVDYDQEKIMLINTPVFLCKETRTEFTQSIVRSNLLDNGYFKQPTESTYLFTSTFPRTIIPYEDEISTPWEANWAAKIAPVYYGNNKKDLTEKLNAEIRRTGREINTSLHKNSIKTINIISSLPFKESAVELTKKDILKITLSFNNNRVLMVSKPPESEKNYIVYSFFIKKELIASDAIDISSLVEIFEKYLTY